MSGLDFDIVEYDITDLTWLNQSLGHGVSNHIVISQSKCSDCIKWEIDADCWLIFLHWAIV